MDLETLYRQRNSSAWGHRFLRFLEPPAPFVANPAEPLDFPLGRWNLYLGAGRKVPGYVNLDLFAINGVDVAADAQQLPFPSAIFARVECDAVLEHVRNPELVMAEIRRVLAPRGYVHLVTPFCHRFHQYPSDFRRFTIEGLRELAGPMEVVAQGWRTGPTATQLVFVLEYLKLLLPFRAWRIAVHGVFGWVLFPFRYLDLLLFRLPESRRIGKHCYMWLRNPQTAPPPAQERLSTTL